MIIYSKIKFWVIAFLLLVLASSCSRPWEKEIIAPGAPGNASVWSYSGKTGIGTSYEMYQNKEFSDKSETGTVSKVWFSLANGVLTETMYGLIHEAQLKELQFIVVGDGFVDYESTDTNSEISYLHTDEEGRPLSLAYRVVNTDIEGKYSIEKHFFTDPDGQSLYMRVLFNAKEKGITPYLYANPHVNNTGNGDYAKIGRKSLIAWDGDTYMTILSDERFEKSSVGFVGVSDGLDQINETGKLEYFHTTTGDTAGNVALMAQLDEAGGSDTYDFVIGFGQSEESSMQQAKNTMRKGYDDVLAHYNGEGEMIGWEDYLGALPNLEQLSTTSTDNGKLLHASALVLKAQEDKTHAGALIASLSNPWGETASAEDPATGYKGVWPRDFYQCAMAFMALGDYETPLVAFEYLPKVQVKPSTPGNKGASGWFMQKTHVDGEIEWVAVQLDQTAMPIMLGWKLHEQGILSRDEAVEWYHTMLKPAADFLVEGGKVDLDWNTTTINPPATQQERWEEQHGYSPSTMAATVSGLVCAADFAEWAGDDDSRDKYLETADAYESMIEPTTFTTSGALNDGEYQDGKYFIRISRNKNPNDGEPIGDNNGRKGLNETKILDGGFLELVRYGVRDANNASVVASLPELDDTSLKHALRVKYLFTFENDNNVYPGWRRYGNDGYGEDTADGSNYGEMTPTQRGRVWPFFTGERGHYELAKQLKSNHADTDHLRNTYVKAMEYFANKGLMLPEQVWDGVGVAPAGYETGEGTNSATPLAWTHAEYVKLLRSISDNAVWDNYPNVSKRYSGSGRGE